MPGAHRDSRPFACLLLLAASCAFSALAILRDPLVSEEGILPLVMAETLLSRGLDAALAISPWPAYALLLAGTQWLTGLSMLACAHLLDTALLALLALAFARLLELLGSEHRFYWWGALVLLLFPPLNGFRSQVVPEAGFWAFLVLSLVPLAHYLVSRRWQHAIAFAALNAVAAAFRPEAFVFGAILPLACFARGLEAPRLEAAVRLYAVLAAFALLPLLAASRFGLLGVVGDGVFAAIEGAARASVAGFEDAVTAMGAQVLGGSSRPLAAVALTAALTAILLVQALVALGPLHAGVLAWAAISRRALVPEGGRGLQGALLVAALLVAVLSLVREQALGTRELLPLALALLLPCAFAARELRLWAGRVRRPLLARAGLVVLVLALLSQGFANPGARRSYLLESIDWMQKSLPAGSVVFSNDPVLAWYSQGRFDWRSIAAGERLLLAGNAPMNGVDYWLVHLDDNDTHLAPALAGYGERLEAVAAFGAPPGRRVVVLRTVPGRP